MSLAGPGTALLLVDLQNDFLARPGLVPDAGALCTRVAELLQACRRRGLPIAHAHTIVRADGADRMPHWKRGEVWQCVEGTHGAEPPASLVPAAGELVLGPRELEELDALPAPVGGRY